jgi:hypothetical protein
MNMNTRNGIVLTGRASLSVALIISCLAVELLNGSAQALPDKVAHIQGELFPNEPPDDFFAGDYVIVGQKPAGGTAYKGRAHIEIKDRSKIRLSRKMNGTTTVVDGNFVPGGELKKKCLRFNWKDSHGNAEMLCQYGVDFDNYARLSCVWSYGKDGKGGLPGFESYYPLDGLSKEHRPKALTQMKPHR